MARSAQPRTADCSPRRSGATRAPSSSLVEPHRGELHAHCYRMLGSVHDADDAMQDAMLRAWRGLASFEGDSSLRSWLYKIATNTCLDLIAQAAQARSCRSTYAPDADPFDGAGPAADRVGLGRALPGRAARPGDGLRRARGALRAARERRAGVHRRAPAPARQPARRADHARGARLLGAGGRRAARDHDRVGQQRAAARPRDGRREAARPEPAGDAARARRRASCSELVESYMDAMQRGDVEPRRRRCWPRTRRGRCRRSPPGTAASAIPRLPARRPAVGRLALAPRADARQRPAGGRLLHVERRRAGATCRSASTC